jgi:steroid delta-isomerase-like uncharacterized protein
VDTEQNKQLVLRWREALNDGNLNAIDELHATDYVGHIAGTPRLIQGREALKQMFAGYLTAFDVHVTPEFLVAEGDMVVIRDTNLVRHIGAFQGLPPTGKELSLPSTDIYRIVGGRIVEQWFEADYLSFMQQLGVLPTPGQAGR